MSHDCYAEKCAEPNDVLRPLVQLARHYDPSVSRKASNLRL
jgi:hypothetical protein